MYFLAALKTQSLSSLVLSLTYFFFQFLGREKGLYAQIHQSSSTPILSRTATTSGRTGSGSLSCPAASCRSPGSLNSSLDSRTPHGHHGPQPPTNDSYARSSSGPGTAHDHSRVPHARGVAGRHAHGRAHDDHGGRAAPGHDDGLQAAGHAPDASSCSTSNDGNATHGSNDGSNEASVCKPR